MTKIIFMGTPDFSVPVLRKLVEDGYEIVAVVTQPDRPVGRRKIMTPPPVKVEAERYGIPVFQPDKIRKEEEAQKIIDLKADLVVTAAYGQILPTTILNAPKYGCINVHASLLPELRGGAPIHYAILEGKKKTGITIMYMVEKLDAGDMISQAEISIDEYDNVGFLHDKLSALGAKLLSETIPKLLAGEIKPVPQDENLATFATNIKREDEKITWADKGETIYNQVRGLCPWPVAYTTFKGKVLKVWKADKVLLNKSYEPGVIIKIEKDSFIIASGDDVAIKIMEVQPAGKKKMHVEQFLNGLGSVLKTGDRLGTNEE